MLGATGSIGASTIDVALRHPDRFRLHALTAHRNVDALVALGLRCRPDVLVIADPALGPALRQAAAAAGLACRTAAGPQALVDVAAEPGVDLVMAAIVGAAGLEPTLAAAGACRRLLLANKESIVMAGRLFMDAVRRSDVELLPIDSEHNALYQCLPPGGRAGAGVRRLVLTASGGPFRDRDPAGLHDVTPDEACAHPRWSMGRKISVDSATMMNKGLELIEASVLFDVPPARVDAVIHPQSIVHSMVEYDDGSVLAQLGNPDMRTPIAHAMAYPQRIDSGVPLLDLIDVGRLEFSRPDLRRFPCLALARQALEHGGGMPCVLNAANEVAVDAFLDGRIAFTRIAGVVGSVLDALSGAPAGATIGDVVALDAQARARAVSELAR